MDFIQQLGTLAWASRMKRLTDRLLRSGVKVYASQDIDFEPRWFLIFSLLHHYRHPLSVTEIAELLGLTHPAVIQITGAMVKNGILDSRRDDLDARRRMLSLSDRGRQLLPVLEPIWYDFEQATRDLFSEIEVDVIAVIEKVEAAFDKQEMSERILDLIRKRHYDAVEIIDYQPEFMAHFKRLNYEWLQEHFEVLPFDEQQLSDPGSEILDRGGFILFALIGGEVIGTTALVKLDSGRYELVKMAVTRKARGRQAGRKLAQTALDRIRSLGAEQVVLKTDNKLQAAINLFRQLGFEITRTPVAGLKNIQRSPWDVTMVLNL
ncbi:GNAT family N-acetyltransferase [candidate division CSSED10-310 bacterium]|uniref:GNAT family N-acetyltransferase n=1 Tax=candidate division CSSED10-310 bacterium TaxID=2855610 RepID=A0ABV6Z1Q8_UNCC1